MREGAPHTAILEYAGEAGVDAIVMGTHGRSGLDCYLLGSVTERVVRTADAPVLTVRMEETDTDYCTCVSVRPHAVAWSIPK